MWFLKTIIRENKKEDHSKVSSLGDRKNELIGRYPQGIQMEVPRRLALWTPKAQTSNKDPDSQGRAQSKGSINVYGTCGTVNEGKWEKRRKPDQRHEKEAPALNHASAPNPCLQGTFRLSHL